MKIQENNGRFFVYEQLVMYGLIPYWSSRISFKTKKEAQEFIKIKKKVSK